jgi:hypothetical protein
MTSGTIEFKTALGSVTVGAGSVAEARPGQPPTQRPFSEKELRKQEEGTKGGGKSSDKKSEGESKQGEKTASKSDGETSQAKGDSSSSSADAASASADVAAAIPTTASTNNALNAASQSSGAPGGSITGNQTQNANTLPVTETTGDAVNKNTNVKIKINH